MIGVTGGRRRLRFAIVGAGPGGLATAIALRELGHEPIVFEQAPALRTGGGALALWPHGTRALATLIGPDAAAALGPAYDRSRIQRWDGTTVHDLPIARHAAHYGGWLMAVDRGSLIAALAARAGVVHTGARITAVEQDPHAVHLTIEGRETESFDGLVGADGISSVVRAAIGIPTEARGAGMTAWLGTSTCIAGNRRVTTTTEGQGRRFLHLPHATGAWWYAYTHDSLAVADRRQLRHVFRHFPRTIVDLIEDTPDHAILKFSLRDRPASDRWGAGRVTLLGDAAHATTPDLGQGACLALEDAVRLAAHVAETEDLPLAFRSYESERAPRAAGLQGASWAISQASFATSDLACQLRDAALAAAPEAALLSAFSAMFAGPYAGEGTTDAK